MVSNGICKAIKTWGIYESTTKWSVQVQTKRFRTTKFCDNMQLNELHQIIISRVLGMMDKPE